MRIFALILTVCISLSAQAAENSASPSRGKAFNPDISVNFLGLFQHGTQLSDARTAVPRNGVTLQEAELHFSSDVDAYFRAQAILAISQENGETKYGIDPEEVFLETISLPYVTVKAGKFKMAMGRHNQMHTHAFPFIDAPLIHQRLLSDEGLNEKGVSASVLLPTSWFSEFTFQGMSLDNEALFNSQTAGDWGGLARLKNLWDLNDSTTMELGFSALGGNNMLGRKSSVLGGDLTFKWRPTSGGKYKALIWSTEYLLGQREAFAADRTIGANTVSESTKTLGGGASWLQYQFAQRWWAQLRYEYVGLQRSSRFTQQIADKQSVLLGFFPSEFSGLRVQYDRIHDRARARRDYGVAVQYNVSLGAHPAHAY